MSKKIDGIWLTTQKDNYNAIRLYQSKDFKIDEDYDNCLKYYYTKKRIYIYIYI